MKLIFAQGNPESKYAATRHNVGFIILDALAEQYEAKWTEKSKFHAYIAELTIEGEKVLLVKPTTYYNETGVAARKITDFYHIDVTKDLLVIHDELALPFGTIRTRGEGSDAGNNGIKSLNSHIGPNYSRIRIGIANDMRERVGDVDFVLSAFNKDETLVLNEQIKPTAAGLVDNFITDSFEFTSHRTD